MAALAADMAAEDEKREALIKGSREVLKGSKAAIYAAHRGDLAGAARGLAAASDAVARNLLPTVAATPGLRYALAGALEEYAEAVIFHAYLATGRIPRAAEVPHVTRDEYLGGLMDATGELGRHAVLRATERDLPAVTSVRNVLDAIHYHLMGFDFRNGNLRRKYDAVKYTVKKVEQLVYEQSLVAHLGFAPSSGAGAAAASADDGAAAAGGGGEGDGEGEVGGGGEGEAAAGAFGGAGAKRGGGSWRGGGRGGGAAAKRGRVD